MPMVGVISPDHAERRASGTPGRLPRWLKVDELLEQAYYSDPKWSPWSYELLKAALVDEWEERGDRISTSLICSPCPRGAVLERMEDYVGDVDKLWRAFRGTMIHSVLEKAARPNSTVETRFFTEVEPGVLISGKPDLVAGDGHIWDYKTGKTVPRYDYMYSDHSMQLQLNRYIINRAVKWEKDDKPIDLPFNPHDTIFKWLVIGYMDIDGPKPLVDERSIDVPTKDGKKTKKRRVPYVQTDIEVQEWFLPRYRAYKLAFEAYPEWPDGAEKVWGGEPGWACPGYPVCPLRGLCLAAKYPGGLMW